MTLASYRLYFFLVGRKHSHVTVIYMQALRYCSSDDNANTLPASHHLRCGPPDEHVPTPAYGIPPTQGYAPLGYGVQPAYGYEPPPGFMPMPPPGACMPPMRSPAPVALYRQMGYTEPRNGPCYRRPANMCKEEENKVIAPGVAQAMGYGLPMQPDGTVGWGCPPVTTPCQSFNAGARFDAVTPASIHVSSNYTGSDLA